MATPTPSTFNLLSVNETGAVELTGQQKLINLAKIDLLESLDKNGDLINRNACADTLSVNRFENGKNSINAGIPAGKVNIHGKVLNLDNVKYKDILDEYEKTIQIAVPADKDKKLEELDILFAERLILDSENMIEFGPKDTFKDGKTAEQESKKAYEELNKMPEYQDKVERAKKLLGNEQHFVVKWTEEQIKMIDRIKTIAAKIQDESPVAKQADDLEAQKALLTGTANEKDIMNTRTEKLNTLRSDIMNPIILTHEDGKTITIVKYDEDAYILNPDIPQDLAKYTKKVDNKLFINKENLLKFLVENNAKLQQKTDTTDEKNSPITETEKEIETNDGRKIKIKLTGKETADEIIKKIMDALAADKVEQAAHKEVVKQSVEKMDITLLVNRDNLSDALSKSRKDKDFPMGSLEIKTGTFVDIEKQAHFDSFKQKYIEAKGNELRLKDLDTEFAEHIILNNPPEAAVDKKYYIQINNDEAGKNTKTEKELEQEALRCRDSLQNEGYDVEYVRQEHTETELKEDESKKRELSEMKQEIGILTGKIAELEGELNSKRLHHTESDRVSKQEELKKLKQKLVTLQADYDKLEKEATITTEKKKIYHIVRLKGIDKPIPVPPEPTPEELELNAVISDMGTDVHRERVSFETEEELREKYKNLGRYNLPARAYLFLSRGAKRKRMIKAKMNAMAGKAFSVTGDATKDAALNDKTGNASDRHELELAHKLDKVESKLTVQNPQVNDLCKQFLNGTITEDQFQPKFNAIIDADAAIQAALKGEKVTHIGTNILEKLKLQKAKWDLSKKIETEFNKTPIDMHAINAAITQYIKDFQVNPEFMKDYEDFINSVPGAKNKLDTYFRHQGAVMKMQATNIKMNIDILVKGKSAYQIDNKDRQKGRAYKTGKFLDKLPRWVQTAGFVGISVGTGIATAGLGTVAAAAITTGVTASSVGFLNAIKKRTHYTKEQNTHEKDMVTDYRKEQAKLKERQERALNGKRYQWKTYKARRQLALYDQTTQENIFISDTITDSITDLSSKVGPLTADEQTYMQKNLIQGWARLKYYREMGHNFLASNDKEKIEKDMKRLEKAIILGVAKVGKTLPDIETMQATDDTGANLTYATVRKDLESSYKKSLIQFKRERRRLAAKYGIGTAALSAGMSLGMQYLLGTGVFAGKGTPGVDGHTATINSHDHFDLGKADILSDGTKNHVYNTATDILKDPRVVDGSTITLNYGAGTDATQVIAGRLTPAVYQAKLSAIASNINSMDLTPATKSGLISYINQHPREQSWATQNFTNDALHGMRVAEIIETNAKALADAGRTDFIFHVNYDPKLDVVGTGVKNAAERVANCSYTVQTPSVPGSDPSALGSFLQFPVFFNTFEDVNKKEKDKKAKDDKKTKTKPQQAAAQ